MFVNFVGPVGRLGLLGFKLMEIDASQRGIFGHLVKMVVHGRFYEHLSIPPKTYLLREPQHTWRIILLSKWLITMVRKSPK